jgi:hypothetical protein
VFGTVDALSATFVIDVSSSMGWTFTLEGKTYSRLNYVQEHLSKVIGEQLKPYQKFNVISFSDGITRANPAPVNATAANTQVRLLLLLAAAAVGASIGLFKSSLENGFFFFPS